DRAPLHFSFFLIFSTSPPPPHPTLFPYTTLFRSETRGVVQQGAARVPAPHGGGDAVAAPGRGHHIDVVAARVPAAPLAARPVHRQRGPAGRGERPGRVRPHVRTGRGAAGAAGTGPDPRPGRAGVGDQPGRGEPGEHARRPVRLRVRGGDDDAAPRRQPQLAGRE